MVIYLIILINNLMYRIFLTYINIFKDKRKYNYDLIENNYENGMIIKILFFMIG